uniref:Uncharacterized protein n=1 Tax=Knipowitschia caucasica TaxID=637954 RepID=A0AAV2KFN0_KNICA
MVPVCSDYGPCVLRLWSLCPQSMVPVCSDYGPCVPRVWSLCPQSMVPVSPEYGLCVPRVWSLCAQTLVPVCSDFGPCVLRVWSLWSSEYGPCVLRLWSLCPQSKLVMEGFRSLKEGEPLEFTYKKSSKGLESLRVTGPGGGPCTGSDRRPKGKLPVHKRKPKGDR